MNNKSRLIITVVTFLAFALMSVGFATYRIRLNVAGVATFTKNGKIAITNVALVSSSNITDPQDPTFTDNSINFNLDFHVQNHNDLTQEYKATYEVTLSNTSFYDYIFASATFTPTIETTNNTNLEVSFTVEDVEAGDVIASGETKTFTVVFDMYPSKPGDYNVSGETIVDVEQGNAPVTYTLMGSIPNRQTLDLRVQTSGKVVVTVINTYPEIKTFTISNSGNNFTLVDVRDRELGQLRAPANSTNDFDIYVKRNSGATFPTSPQRINLYFTPTGGTRTNMGTVSISVPVDSTIVDETPPLISDVQAERANEVGKIKLSWNATDDSGINHFIIEQFDDSNTLLNTITTQNANTEYTFSGVSEGTYYFQVYGVDNSSNHNSGKTNATRCSTDEGYCSRSTSSSFSWTFNVTNNCSNCTFTGDSTVIMGDTYTATVRAANWYELPDTITVTMGGTTLNANSYTYNQNNGSISIPNVTGDLNIRVTANFSCLVKGTKILLANGKYKNIENVTYNDLLAVWNYETGSITYEYPIWLEKKSFTNKYRKTTFSDGTSISTVALHGLFSPTYNEFIAVNDEDKYKVGTEILKIKDGKFNKVRITKIEDIYKQVEYYHVVSTRYYNVIANDVLTTDGTVILSNLYGFTEDLKWPSSRKTIMSNKLYKYDEFKDILPYYMFKGMRVEEGAYLENFGLTYEIFKYYLATNQVNEEMMRKVDTNDNGKRVWMVTTSEDEVNMFNYSLFLHEEGDYYKLPKYDGVTKWYSTSENKYYKPLEQVKVVHGMHFIAIK